MAYLRNLGIQSVATSCCKLVIVEIVILKINQLHEFSGQSERYEKTR